MGGRCTSQETQHNNPHEAENFNRLQMIHFLVFPSRCAWKEAKINFTNGKNKGRCEKRERKKKIIESKIKIYSTGSQGSCLLLTCRGSIELTSNKRDILQLTLTCKHHPTSLTSLSSIDTLFLFNEDILWTVIQIFQTGNHNMTSSWTCHVI